MIFIAISYSVLLIDSHIFYLWFKLLCIFVYGLTNRQSYELEHIIVEQ